MFQFRPSGSPNALYYSPGRDIAHCGLKNLAYGSELCMKALNDQPHWLVKYMTIFDISKEDVIDGLRRFEDSVVENCQNIGEKPLRNHSFSNVPQPVQVLILHFMSLIFVGESIKGWKDITLTDALQELDPEEFKQKSIGFARVYNLDPPWQQTVIRGVRSILNGIDYGIRLISNLFNKMVKRDMRDRKEE